MKNKDIVFNVDKFLVLHNRYLKNKKDSFYKEIFFVLNNFIDFVFNKYYLRWFDIKEDLFSAAHLKLYETLYVDNKKFNPKHVYSFIFTIIKGVFFVYIKRVEDKNDKYKKDFNLANVIYRVNYIEYKKPYLYDIYSSDEDEDGLDIFNKSLEYIKFNGLERDLCKFILFSFIFDRRRLCFEFPEKLKNINNKKYYIAYCKFFYNKAKLETINK